MQEACGYKQAMVNTVSTGTYLHKMILYWIEKDRQEKNLAKLKKLAGKTYNMFICSSTSLFITVTIFYKQVFPIVKDFVQTNMLA